MSTNTEAMRAALYRAAIDCAHEIERERIVLHYDPKQEGPNALAQLADRVERAALAQAEQRQGASAWVGLTEGEKDTSNIGWGREVEYLLGYEAGMDRAEELLRAKNAAPQPEVLQSVIDAAAEKLPPSYFGRAQPKEPKQRTPGLCRHASSGCNYPEGECSGACFPTNMQRQAS